MKAKSERSGAMRFGAFRGVVVRLVGLVMLVGATGCTSRAAGQVAFGILGAVAAAAVRGAVNAAVRESGSSSAAPADTWTTLSACEQDREAWRDANPDLGAPLPARLRCTPNGAYPEQPEPAPDDETAAAKAAERTGVTTNLCGNPETPETKCVKPRAPVDFL